MVVFYLDGTFNCNQDKLYNKRDLRDKSQICIITSQIETICYKNEGKFRTCECLSPALLSQEHDERMPKLLWIPSTTNCTRAALQWRTTCWWSYARMLITILINDICFLHVLMKRKLPVDENSKGGGGRVGLFAKIVLACVAGVLRGRVIKHYKLVLVYPTSHVWYRVILDGGGRGRVNGDKKNMNFSLKSSAKLSKLLRPWRFSIKSFFTREVRRDTFVTIKTTGEVI